MIPKLGIAVTTYNRREMIVELVDRIRKLTATDFNLVICDDGSSDGTAEILRKKGEIVIGEQNRGVAWNKNRGIYWQMVVSGCDAVLLLDDDIFPILYGWEKEWLDAIMKFGHVNYAFPDMIASLPERSCTAENPGLSKGLGGPCIGISRFVWSLVGYMDPRFLKFGHEHTEYSNRLLDLGYGGIKRQSDGSYSSYYFVIKGGLEIEPANTNGTPNDIIINQQIWEKIQLEGRTYCAPWKDKEQLIEFMKEIRVAAHIAGRSVPNQYRMFVSEKYRLQNYDVLNSSFDPWYHFENFGLREGRNTKL